MRADELDDDQLELCVDGSTSLDLLREIIDKTITDNGYVDEADFAQWFAYALEGYLDADEGTDEWNESNEANYNWGLAIAESINEEIDAS